METKQKPKYNEWQNTCFMLKCAWKAKRKSVILLCILVAVFQLGQNLVELYITPQILAKVESHVPLGELLGTIGAFVGGLLLIYAMLGYLRENTLYGRIDTRTSIIRLIEKKACTTSYPNSQDQDFIKMRTRTQRATFSNYAATEHIWETLTEVLKNILGFGIYLGILGNLNPILVILILLTSAVTFFASRRLDDWQYRHRDEQAKYEQNMTYVMFNANAVELAKDIRIFGLGPWIRDIYTSARGLYEAYQNRLAQINLLIAAVDTVNAVLRNGLAYLFLIQMTLTQGLRASEFVLYFTAISNFSTLVYTVLDKFSDLHKESLELSIIREYLDTPEPFRFEGGKPIPERDAYELALEDVTFRYPGSDKNLFEHLNLTIRPGEKLAIVGLNGAGKTSLVKLLCGFYDPDEGRVLLDGMDIRDFNRQEYYEKFSAVFQEYELMQCTVAENIASDIGDRVDEEKVRKCLAQAGLTEAIEALPQGIHSHVGREVYYDGVLFSGGQTQRLILARALYKNGPILMLDEPTAALDPLAENDIYMKYNEMTAGKTSVFISHRLASTRFCDRILYLANGTIAEEGTHEELLALGGGYADLFEVQSRYYREGCDF